MRKTDFNRDWSVQKEGDSGIRRVNLPDDAMLREMRSADALSGSAGAFFAGGRYFYRKEWNIAEEQINKTMILEFEGVYQKASVSLNGELLVRWPYGYTNFFVDVTGKAAIGKNELVVVADNSQVPNTRWYSGSGIYREVQLYEGGKEYIHPEGVKVAVTGRNQIQVQVDADIEDSSTIVIEVFDQNKVVVKAQGIAADITIPDVKVWDEETPYLYRCRASIVRAGEVLDEAWVNFGMRTLHWGKEGLLVNGKPVLLRGTCIHHDNGVLGACDFRDAEVRRVRIMKEAGFNAIRSAHNPISKAMLDACDALGMYVIDESFDMWLVHKNPYDYAGETFKQWWRADTDAMISKDYNHPSVIMYSMGNEISELGRQDGQDMAREMVSFCHEKDQTRPVTAGINLALAQMAAMNKNKKEKPGKPEKSSDDTTNAPTSEFFNKMMNILGNQMDKAASRGGAHKIVHVLREIFDIPGYNYATSRYLIDAKERPDQATVGSETMTHSLYRNWQLVKQIPTLVGDFIWTGWDYLGESGLGTVRYMDKKTKKDVDPGLIISGGAGLIDICGKMRPEVGWSRTIWGMEHKPVIGVDPYTHAKHFKSKRMWRKADTIASWSWEGYEGVTQLVTIYADAPQVELFLNGKSFGRKQTVENTAFFKKIPYQPGKLEAVALGADGREIARNSLESANGKTRLRLTPEKTTLLADGQELCFLNIDLVGENGITKSTVDQKLKVEVTGAGTLQGFGSARPNMAENFYSDSHTTYYGKALAVIRAGYEPGKLRVKVSGNGIATQEIELEVQSVPT